jgi:methylenetetrahydrofolate reductase (NADPH)
MSDFIKGIEQNKFIITATIDPPVLADFAPAMDVAKGLEGKVDGVLISDNRMAVARMSSLALAGKMKQDTGLAVISVLSCRDKNRLALSSDIMAAAAMGLDGMLMVSGDAVYLGDQRGAKGVHDLDSVMALGLAAKIMPEGCPTCLGATVAVAAEPIEAQAMKLNKSWPRAPGSS